MIVNADNAGIQRTARVIADGGLVAFPTETVYGLGANARDDHAVAQIFEAKNRPRFNPLIVHVPTMGDARRLAQFDDRAEEIANAFWPGPLSI
ncbi:MAG: L-threonylcarbamoyladenylate synthase, partial [Alphaproteobacteria bacterium]|nr:L-threonylcarbamoyladenylate synthase [Alphaproteobacteria bacterium]